MIYAVFDFWLYIYRMIKTLYKNYFGRVVVIVNTLLVITDLVCNKKMLLNWPKNRNLVLYS